MLIQSLLGEFQYEAENTRKLLKAIPDSALSFKPSEISWTTAQLASHIAEIYNWYTGVFNYDIFDMATYQSEERDISTIDNIIAKFEDNLKTAANLLENTTDEALMANWKMVVGEKVVVPEIKRVQAVRGFLMNHLYHHRGEMIVYLRSTGNKVPGLFGPVYEETVKQLEKTE